jgi:hypothetical protein
MAMLIEFNFSGLKRTRWYEYALRFFFGGAVTVAAGLIAQRYGPVFGGLFLAFPAIFPASATLVEKHETQKKRRAGFSGYKRGRKAAALDARGATLGCVGLACFAAALWKLLPRWSIAASLGAGVAIWLTVALLSWRLRRMHIVIRSLAARIVICASCARS